MKQIIKVPQFSSMIKISLLVGFVVLFYTALLAQNTANAATMPTT